MKIKIVAHYEADPSEGFEDNCGTVEVCSEETNLSLDDLINGLEDMSSFEEETGITLDSGGDDEYYELDLPDYADSKAAAQALAQKVYDEAIELLDDLISDSPASGKIAPQPTDFIVCVQQEDNGGSGDTGSVLFLNLTTLETDTHKDCKKYAKAIRKILNGKERVYGSGPKMGGTTDFAETAVCKHEVKLPCMVSDYIVVFVG